MCPSDATWPHIIRPTLVQVMACWLKATSHHLNQCWLIINTLRLRQNGCHFLDNVFKWTFLNENVWISDKISLKFVAKGPINNIPAFIEIMACCHSGDKPLSEPMMVILLTHTCVTRPQWVKWCPVAFTSGTFHRRHCRFQSLKCVKKITHVNLQSHLSRSNELTLNVRGPS